MLLRLEKWLESQVERFFGPRESVQPIEIARRMVRAMEEQRRISVQRTYVPNSFVVHVSQEDLTELESFTHTLAQDLANHVKAAAQRQGFAFPGPISVSFEAESELARGETRIETQFVEDESHEKSAEAPIVNEELPNEAADVRSGHTGRYHPQSASDLAPSNMESTQLYKAGRKQPGAWRVNVEEGPDAGAVFTVRLPISVGRRQGCDIQLHDPKVSRLHARLEMAEEGLIVIDNDSMNGTRLNGQVVHRSIISPGDVMELGASRLTIQPVGGE